MKIESRGFRITDICPQMSSIEVDSEGMVSVHAAETPGAMTREQFDALFEAMEVVRERLDGKAHACEIECKASERPLVIVDKSNDVWVWRDDHNAYVIATNGHENCARDKTLDDGSTLEYIEKEWGPLTFPMS